MANVQNFRISELDSLFNHKLTENGDDSHISTGNRLVDYMFQAEYYQKHLNKVVIGNSDIEKLFAMFVRDPRHGMKYRDLGRVLERKSGVSAEAVAFAGRFDDLWEYPLEADFCDEWISYLFEQVNAGNELAKKWMPHYVASKKNGEAALSTIMASRLRKKYNELTGSKLNKQQYGKLVKVDTVERKLTDKDYDSIDFSKLPSLALLKYWSRFAGTGKNFKKTEMKERFEEYLASVKKGEAKMNFTTATVYDIYRNASAIDADIAFAQIEKINGSWIPILDSSRSMFDENDSIGKACSIAHYLAKTSTYAPNRVISFGDNPRLIDITKPLDDESYYCYANELKTSESNSEYAKEIIRMFVGFDGNSTNFKKTMDLLQTLETEFPKYIIVLSDMEFNVGGASSASDLTRKWANRGIETKIIWWNFNARACTSPQAIRSDADGNVFISGYDPTMLKFLESSFDAEKFLQKLLAEYAKTIPEGLNI